MITASYRGLWPPPVQGQGRGGGGAEQTLNPQNPEEAWQGAAAGNDGELIIL